MKILQLALSLGAGGAERLVLGLCNEHADNTDDEIVLVTLKDNSISKNVHYLPNLSKRVRFINLHCQSALQAKTIWRVLKIIRREKPDIVHCHTNVLLLFFPVIFLKNIYFFQTIHTLAKRQYDNANIIKRKIMAYLYSHNKVKPVTISQTCHQSYWDTYRLSNDICIYNGCEAMVTTDEHEIVKKEIDKLKRNDETVVFIHVARHHPVKNHKRLFRNFTRLEEEGYNFVLLVLGDNYDSLIDQYHNNRYILFLGAKNNVGDYLAQADYFVLSSDAEGLPMTLLEAMSMGVVPISTPAGGVVDVIKDGVNGYLAKSFEDEEFFQILTKAIHEKGTISSESLKKEYKEKYSIDICAEKYYDAYKKILST